MAKKLIVATWDDVPHLDEEEKRVLFDALPPHQRDARSRGIPSLGSGAIYPVPESEITVEPFRLPDHYLRSGGFDVGWNATACLWSARDPDSGVVYVYDTYKKGQAEPVIHSHAIKARGAWIPLAIDYAARGRGQRDGETLFNDYIDLGLDLVNADKSVEAGLYRVWQMLSTGQLKVFSTCHAFFQEYRIYRRDEKGAVVKENDHLMDCLRYDIMTGIDIAVPVPVTKDSYYDRRQVFGSSDRCKVTGY